MPFRTRVLGCVCLVLAGEAARAEAATAAQDEPSPAVGSVAGVAFQPPAKESGVWLDRRSKGDLRIWRAIEQVVEDSDPSGAPRSPTLRRLMDWARTSPHVLHIEMVPPSRLAAGMVGVFDLLAFDPAGLR